MPKESPMKNVLIVGGTNVEEYKKSATSNVVEKISSCSELELIPSEDQRYTMWTELPTILKL